MHLFIVCIRETYRRRVHLHSLSTYWTFSRDPLPIRGPIHEKDILKADLCLSWGRWFHLGVCFQTGSNVDSVKHPHRNTNAGCTIPWLHLGGRQTQKLVKQID